MLTKKLFTLALASLVVAACSKPADKKADTTDAKPAAEATTEATGNTATAEAAPAPESLEGVVVNEDLIVETGVMPDEANLEKVTVE